MLDYTKVNRVAENVFWTVLGIAWWAVVFSFFFEVL